VPINGLMDIKNMGFFKKEYYSAIKKNGIMSSAEK
jgi:hypothetical protein